MEESKASRSAIYNRQGELAFFCILKGGDQRQNKYMFAMHVEQLEKIEILVNKIGGSAKGFGRLLSSL